MSKTKLNSKKSNKKIISCEGCKRLPKEFKKSSKYYVFVKTSIVADTYRMQS